MDELTDMYIVQQYQIKHEGYEKRQSVYNSLQLISLNNSKIPGDLQSAKDDVIITSYTYKHQYMYMYMTTSKHLFT